MKPVDWSKRWAKEADPDLRSRAHCGIMRHIQTDPARLREMVRKHAPLTRMHADASAWAPAGAHINGVFYTANSVRIGAHVRRLQLAGAFKQARAHAHASAHALTVCEIGPGFGALARVAINFRLCDRYCLIDDARMTQMQIAYLYDCLGAGALDRVLHAPAVAMCPTPIDLVIAINSTSEMQPQAFARVLDEIGACARALYISAQKHRGDDCLRAPARWSMRKSWDSGDGEHAALWTREHA